MQITQGLCQAVHAYIKIKIHLLLGFHQEFLHFYSLCHLYEAIIQPCNLACSSLWDSKIAELNPNHMYSQQILPLITCGL